MTDDDKLKNLKTEDVAPLFPAQVWHNIKKSDVTSLKKRDYKWEVIEGRYRDKKGVFTPVATVVNGQLFTYCDCPDFRPGHPCVHVGYLLWAWIEQRDTFHDTLKQYKPKVPLLNEEEKSRPNLRPLGPPTEKEKKALKPLFSHLSFAQSREVWLNSSKKLLEQRELKRTQLQALGKQWGLKLGNQTRPKMIEAIVRRSADPEAVQSQLSQWSVEEQQALTAVVPFACHSTHLLPVQIVGRFWSYLPGPWTKPLKHSWEKAERQGLFTRFLLYGDDDVGWGMPMVIAAALPPLPGWLPPRRGNLPAHWRVVQRSPGVVIRHLRDFIEACQTLPVRLRSQQRPMNLPPRWNSFRDWPYSQQMMTILSKRRPPATWLTFYLPIDPPAIDADSATIVGQMTGMDDQEIDLLYHLLKDDNWIYPGSPVTVSTHISSLLQLDDTELWVRIARLYWHSPLISWTELNLLRRLHPDIDLFYQHSVWGGISEWREFLNRLLEQRKIFVHFLALLPQGVWIDYNALQSVLKLIWHDAVHGFASSAFHKRLRSQFDDLFLSDASRNYPLRWENTVGRLLDIFIEYPLHWLGVVDLAYEEETLRAVRLNLTDLFYADMRPLSQRVTAAPRSPVLPAPEHRYIYDPQKQQLAIPLALLSPERIKVISFLTKEVTYRREESLLVGHVAADRVSKTFDQHINVDEIEKRWQAAFGAPMAVALLQQLRQWEANYGHWRIYTGNLALVEVKDSVALRELKAVSSLQTLIFAELSPYHVLIPDDKVDAFIQELQKKGYTPKLIKKGAFHGHA